MCARALKPLAVSDEPYIHTGRDSQKKKGDEDAPIDQKKKKGDADAPIDKDLCGDIGVHGFWKTGTSTIFDVRITDTDCATWHDRDPHKVLAHHEKEKKKLYSVQCTARRRHFTPLVFSCDGMIAVEASAAIKPGCRLLEHQYYHDGFDLLENSE